MPAPDIIAEYLITKLSADLAAELTTLEADYGDSVELGTAQYWRSPQGAYPSTLNILAVAEENDPGTRANSNYRETAAVVEIIAAGEQSHATYQPAATINKRVWRVARAVQAVLHNQDLADGESRALVRQMTFAAPLDGDDWQEQRVEVDLDVFTST